MERQPALKKCKTNTESPEIARSRRKSKSRKAGKPTSHEHMNKLFKNREVAKRQTVATSRKVTKAQKSEKKATRSRFIQSWSFRPKKEQHVEKSNTG